VSKKDGAASFLRLASEGQAREAHEPFAHPQFRHHKTYFKGDRESLFGGMAETPETFQTEHTKHCVCFRTVTSSPFMEK